MVDSLRSATHDEHIEQVDAHSFCVHTDIKHPQSWCSMTARDMIYTT